MKRPLSALPLLILAACDPAPAVPPTTAPTSTSAAVATPAPSATTTPSTPVPAMTTPTPGGATSAATAANNAFGVDLYKRIAATGDGNTSMSPVSASIALSMTAAGAQGDTATQMQKALAIGDAAAIDGSWATVMNEWSKVSDVELAMANRLFGDKSYTFEKPFLELTKQRYGAPMMPVDFAGAPQVQRKLINDWVSEQTRKRINDLIPPPGVTNATRLALVNAVYFKAKWETPFNTHHTRDAKFTLGSGDKVDVPTMHRTGHMGYGEVDGHQIAELDYAGDRFAATFVLPKDGDMKALEASLDAKKLDAMTASIASKRIELALPKFKLDPASSANLKPHLIAMGMTDAFTRKADFKGITKPPSKADELFIENVFHKAFVAMDESGTEAAAATAVVMGRKGAMMGPTQKFHADRPFMFLIRDKKTGMVMFVGRVMNPKA